MIAGHATREQRTVPGMLQRAAERSDGAPLVTIGETSWSAPELMRVASRAAELLRRDYGVRPGDTVALILHNRPEFLAIVLGAAWLGAVSAPLNTAAKGEQLRHMLANSTAGVVFVEPELAERVRAATPAAAEPVRVVPVSEPNAWAAAPPAADAVLPEPADIAQGDPFVVLYTSGTTGVSKGVLCPHAQYFWWAKNNIELLELRSGDVLLSALPLFHTNALSTLFQALECGGSVVYERRFSASGFLASVEHSGATVTYLLGAMVPILLTVPPNARDASTTLQRVLAPGVPAHAIAEFTERFGVAVVDGFASTESNFVIGARAREAVPGTMGTVRAGFEARVADANDAAVPDGTPGELLLRAHEPFAFALGYRGMDEATVASWRNLWLHTGDRVVRDAAGRFTFLDRMKDVIRRRGENISSVEVESALLSHPYVEAVAVFPVPSELAEDEVMAAVVLAQGATLAPDELLAHAEDHLAYFAVPRYVEYLRELPLTENGKVRKFLLRERGVSADTWDREQAGYRLRRTP